MIEIVFLKVAGCNKQHILLNYFNHGVYIGLECNQIHLLMLKVTFGICHESTSMLALMANMLQYSYHVLNT